MYLYRYRLKLFLIAMGLCLDAMLALAFASCLSYLVDNILIGGKEALFPSWVLGTVLITICSCLSNIYMNRFLPLKEELNASIVTSRNTLMNLLNLNYKNYSRNDKGYYYNVVTNCAFAYGEITTNLYTYWIANIIIVLAVMGINFYINPMIGALFVLYIPITLAATIKPSQISSDFQKKGMPTQDAYLNETRRIIESKREINISRTKDYFIHRYRKISGQYLNFITKFRFYEILSTALPATVSKFYSILILSVSAVLCFHGKMTVGSILFIYQVLNYVSDPISAVFDSLIRKKVNQTNISRVETIHEQAKEPSGFERLRATDHLVDASSFSLYRDDREKDLLFKNPLMHSVA